MRTKRLIQPFVGTEKIVVKDVSYDAETNAIIIDAQPAKRERCRCGICHRKAVAYDRGRGLRYWRCSDLGSTKAYVRAEAPRVNCKRHGVVTAAVPWARHGSRFCRPFEDTVAWLCVHTSKSVVAELMRVEWHTVGGICKRVYDELEACSTNRFDGLVKLGIDETSYKKGASMQNHGCWLISNVELVA